MREYTYPKRQVSTNKLSLFPRREANRARRRSWAYPSQTHLEGAALPVGYIWISRLSVILKPAEEEREVWEQTASCDDGSLLC